jgi:hypothetical protein
MQSLGYSASVVSPPQLVIDMTGGLIVFWLICGVIAAVIASAKNRNAH